VSAINYGVLSTASIVPRFVGAVRSAGKGTVLAIASRSRQKAEAAAQRLDIPRAYGSYEEMLEDGDVDVVYVATINSEHFAACRAALEHGKHVVCEKPFVLRKAEAEALFRLAAERHLFIMEAQKVVFLPLINAVAALIREGRIGTVRLVDLTSSCEATYNNWLGSLAAGGGALYGNASYGIQMLAHLFGEMPVYRGGAALRGEGGADVQCVLNLSIGQDLLAISKISTQVNAINKAFLYGDKGYVEIPDYWKARTARVVYDDGRTEELSFPCTYELGYEVEHVEACLAQGLLTSPVMSEAMTVSTIEMLESVQASWGV
jgi:predicted dehydrogenase